MEAITIHPSNSQQLAKVIDILKELGIPFENQPNISNKLSESINRGLRQSDRGELTNMEDFKKKFSLK